MKVVFTPRAEEDFLLALEFLRRQNPDAAVRFAQRVFAAVDILASAPVDGPVHRLWNGQECRSWPVTPVRLFYSRSGETLTIVRVYHGARSPIVDPR